MKKNYEITFNVPLFALLLSLVVLAKLILKLLGSNSSALTIINYAITFVGLLLCLFVVISSCYYFFKISVAECRFCGKELENRTEKAMSFLLAPP